MKNFLFEEIILDATSKFEKIEASKYLESGQYKIVDQGKNAIAGYTNQSSNIKSAPYPSIVFGDHTRILKYVDEPIILGADGTKALIVRSKDFYTKYIFYYLKSLNLDAHGYSRHYKFLKRNLIPIPMVEGQISFNDQYRIASILDKVEKLIDNRKAHIRKLNGLLRNVFLNMFGDPVKNTHGWKTLPLTEVGEFISGGTPSKAREDFWNGTFPWISPKDMKVSYLWDSEDHISEKAFLESGIKRIPENSILIVVRGMILAHSFPVAINKMPVAINQDMKAIIPGNDFHYIYLQNCLMVQSRQILAAITTAGHGTKKFDTVMMENILIPYPSKLLQIKFAETVERIDLLKRMYQTSLADLENLYGALSQRAFKGELDLSRVPLLDGAPEAVTIIREPQSAPFEVDLPYLPGIVADLNAFNTSIQAIGPELAALRASSAQMEVMNLLLEVSSPAEQWQRLPRVLAVLQGDVSTQDMPAVAGALAAGQAALDKAQGAQVTALPGAEAAFQAMQQTFRDAQQQFPLYLGHTETPEPTEELQEAQPAPEESAEQDDEFVDEPTMFTKEQVLEAFRKHTALKAGLRPTTGLPFSRFSKLKANHLETYNSFRTGLFALLAEGTLSQVYVWPKPPFRSPSHPLSYFIDLVEHPIITVAIKRFFK